MSVDIIRYLEELAANAWPPTIIQLVDGWRFRFSYGISRRGNSVLPNETGGFLSIEEKIALAESFYGRYQVPARFQICPAALPSELDIILQDRGYVIDGQAHVQTAVINAILQKIEPQSAVTISLQERMPETWLQYHQEEHEATSESTQIRRQIFSRIGPKTAYFQALKEGQTVGIGLGVYERGAVGVFNMHTHPGFRRQGMARTILHAIAQWGKQLAATQMYLQVMIQNAEALNFYKQVGFVTLYDYHFRKGATAHT